MADATDEIKKGSTPTGATGADLALSRDAETTKPTTTPAGITPTNVVPANGDEQQAATLPEKLVQEDDMAETDELSGSEETGFNLYSGVDEEVGPVSQTPKKSEEEAFMDAMTMLVTGQLKPETNPANAVPAADVTLGRTSSAPKIETAPLVDGAEEVKPTAPGETKTVAIPGGAEKVAPPVAEKVAPPAADKVAPPAAEKVAPPAAEKVAPPAADKVTPPAADKVAPPAAEKVAPPVEKVESKPVVEQIKETDETIINRAKVKAIQPDLDRLLANLPTPEVQEVDLAELRKKVDNKQFDKLTVAELRAAVKLEAEEPGFGQRSGFKCTEEASNLSNQWLNTVVVDSHALLAKARLSRGPGDPISLSTVGTDPLKPKEGFAHRPETFDALFSDGVLNLAKLKDMQKSGQIESTLIFEPKGIPSVSDMNKMSNSLDWLNNNHARLKEGHDLIYANGYHNVLTDILGIKDKPGWQPPKDVTKLEAYSAKMAANLNLMFRVRNYAESIQSLNNIGGDFKSQALEKLKGLGQIEWDADGRRITKLNLKLPDSLESTVENEVVLQKLRDWLAESSGPVDAALAEYERANPIRYGDVPQKGTIGTDGSGKVVYTKDAEGNILTLVAGGKVYNKNIYGSLVDAESKPISKEDTDKAVASAKTVENFDYLTQTFKLRNSEKTVDVTTTKDYRKDHFLNQQNLIGLPRGEITENRSIIPWQHALVQTQNGRSEFVRGDRLGEFQAIQGFFHYGAKVAAIALDVGMIASGGIGIKAAVTAGRSLSVAANTGRVLLGVGGFLDPALRQMGEAGETVRDLRHKAILLDVTQGLARQGVGKLLGGGMLFQGKGAAEVAKIIETTAWMHRTEQVTRGAFMAADGVWLPLMYDGASDKVARMRGRDPAASMDKALIRRGSGLEEEGKDTGFGSAGVSKFDAGQAAKKVFDAYAPRIGDGKNQSVRAEFDKTQKAIASGDQKQVEKVRDDLLGLFHPSGASLRDWKKSHDHKPALHAEPGTLSTEKSADRLTKVADAISLLFLAQKDGKLPEGGVLAKRTVTVPGYSYYVSGGGEGAPPVEVIVPDEAIEQKVTVNQILGILQNAALDKSDPQTQLVAADALWRSGAMATGKYAGVCLNIVEQQSSETNKDLKMQALKQLSDLILVKRIEETDPNVTAKSRLHSMTESYGLSEGELLEKLGKLAKRDADPDVQAMCAALVKAHEIRIEENAKAVSPGAEKPAPAAVAAPQADAKAEEKSAPKPDQSQPNQPLQAGTKPAPADGVQVSEAKPGDADAGAGKPRGLNAFEKYYEQWQKTVADKSPKGTFHDAFVAELAGIAGSALPELVPGNTESTVKFDLQRKEKLRATLALMDLEGSSDGNKYTKLINDSLFAQLGTVSPPRPDIKLTMEAFNILLERRASLPQEQKIGLADFANRLLEIPYQPIDKFAPDLNKAKSNAEAARAQLLVIGQIDKIFEGKDFVQQRMFLEENLKGFLDHKQRSKGWGQHGMMRVAAIQGLSTLGKGEKDDNVKVIAERLKTAEGAFVENDPYVRAAALQAIFKMDPQLFGLTAEQLTNRGLPNIRPDHLLRIERDPVAVETLYAAHDRIRVYQDPDALPAVAEYSSQVEDMLRGKATTISDAEVLKWINDNESKFGLLDQGKLQAKAKESAKAYLWSGFLGGLDHFFSSSTTIDNAETVRADVEKYGVRRRERDPQFKNLTNFKELPAPDQEMAMKVLLYIIKNADQKLFAADEAKDMRVRAAAALSDLAAWTAQNNDRVQNKDLLVACIVTAVQKAPDDLPGAAKLHLIDAVNSITKRDLGTDMGTGKKVDYFGLSPSNAGALLTFFLQRENNVYDKTAKAHGKEVSKEHQALQYESKQVQLECIDSIYNLRYMGSFAALRARGPDSVLDPANPGSYIPEVRERAKLAVESLFYGTNWLKADAPKRLTGTPEGDASKITSQLIGEQPQHYQFLISDMFASVKDLPLTSTTDQRVAALQQALKHPDQRVRLAGGIAIAESGLPATSEAKIEAARTLRELSGSKLSGHAGIEDVRASLRSFIESAGTKLTGDVLNDAKHLSAFSDKLKATKISQQDADNFCKATIASVKDKPIENKDDPRLTVLTNAMKTSSERVRLAASLAIVDSKLPADHPLRAEASTTLKDASVLGGFEVWRLEAGDALLKLKRAEYPQAKIGSSTDLLEGTAWMRDGSPKLKWEMSNDARATQMSDAIAGASKDFNHEKAVVSIFSACADRPIEKQDDPRREVLLNALKHPEERIRLAAAWMLSESKLPLDREDGVVALAKIATKFTSATAGSEARQLLTAMTKIGNRDDQLLAYVKWSEAYNSGSVPGAVPPEKIVEGSFDRITDYVSRPPYDLDFVDHIAAHGTRAQKEAVIAKVMGWSDWDVKAKVRWLYPPVEKPIDKFQRINPSLNMQSCIGAGPKKEEGFKLSLMGYDSDGLDFIGSGKGGFSKGPDGKFTLPAFSYGDLSDAEIDKRLSIILNQMTSGNEVPKATIPESEELKQSYYPSRRFDWRETDWSAFRTISAAQRHRDPNLNELSKLSLQLKDSKTGVQSQPSWRPGLREKPSLDPKAPTVMQDETVNRLYFSVADRSGIGAQLPGTNEGDAKHIKELLNSRQPHNDRATVDGILTSSRRPIEKEDDPRRAELIRGLNHKNDRVRLACAWVLADSKIPQDFKRATATLSDLAVDSKVWTTRVEAKSLLKDMVMLGSDKDKDIALGAWRESYNLSSSRRGDQPPSFTEIDQAKKFAMASGTDTVTRKSYDERKAIFIHMWNAQNPDKKLTDNQVETSWLQPSDYTPMLDRSLGLLDERALVRDPFMVRPFSQKFDVVLDPLGFKAPEVREAGFNFNRGGDWANSYQDKRPWLGRDSQYPNANKKLASEYLQRALDGSELKGAKITVDDSHQLKLKIDATQIGGKTKLPITLGGEKDDAVKFMSAASPALMKQFTTDLFKYKPELAKQDEIPAEELAIMFKNWVDQKALGRQHVVISDNFNETAVEQLVYMPISPGAEKKVTSEAFAARWSDLSQKREAYRNKTLDHFLVEQFKSTAPPTADGNPHWRPSGNPEIKPPTFLTEPPLKLLDRYNSDVVQLLPQDLLDSTKGTKGGVKITTLKGWMAGKSDDELLVAPGLADGDAPWVITDPRDQAVINAIRAQRIQRSLKNLNSATKDR
jgi:hypothetical protein